MNQHRNYDVVRKHQIIANAENRIPENQQVEEIKLASKKKAQPATEKDKVNQYLPIKLISFIDSHAKQRQGNFELQQMIVQVQILLRENLVSDDV